MRPRVSVVVSTYNRLPLLGELLDALGRQALPPDQFEVIVVDDGSQPPVAPALAGRHDAYHLTVLTQANAGATVVLGHIADDEAALDAKPLFERFHAHQLRRFVAWASAHPQAVRGVHVCTGNVSFRREDYERVGGFDRSLERSEDRELGVRLQETGARLSFAEDARTTNRSDHVELATWLRRNYLYGISDSRIGHRHPGRLDADPWHYLFLVSPLSRGLLLAAVASPRLGHALARGTYRVAEAVDRARGLHPALERAALAGATLSYGLEYFRGVRDEAGSATR